LLVRKLYYLQKVWRQQWMRPEELRRLQDAKLRAMVRHAYANVPFYRRAWKAAGVRPEDVRGAEDMRKLPVISRALVCKNYGDFIAANYRRYYKSGSLALTHTSGTSGMLMETPFDLDAWDYAVAITHRSLVSVGCGPMKRLAYYWYEKQNDPIYHSVVFRKTYMLSSMDESEHIAALSRMKPDCIHYYASTLYAIAQRMLHEGVRITPEVVLTHAEVLAPNMAKKISDAFDAPIVDMYAMNEFQRVAWQCASGSGYHVDADYVLHEIVAGDGGMAGYGEVGGIVLTGLSNMLFPLIRYDTGDVGTSSERACECGRGLPLIDKIEGRRSKTFRLRGGHILTERDVADAVAGVDGVFKFNVSYPSENRFDVRIVPVAGAGKLVDNAKIAAVERLREAAKEIVHVKVKVVDDVKRDTYGKMEFVSAAPRGRPTAGRARTS
jgi:phenylacetate-CoA ligase